MNSNINDPYNIFTEDNITPSNFNQDNTPSSTFNQEIITPNNYNQESITPNNIVDNNNNNQKKPKKKINIISIILVLAFISVCTLVIKTFTYSKKIETYEETFTTIEKKREESAIVYEGNKIDTKILKKIAATELISCINSQIDANNLPEELKKQVNEITAFYNQSNNYFAYTYKDIYTGFTVSYNANQNIFSASSIKAPKDIYIYEMASEGKIDLDEVLTYTGNYYNTGSGVLKNKPVNTQYTVRTLLQYSTVDSDNAAHNMLMDRFGRENMLKFWQEKGTTGIFTNPNNWGVTNAHDATIYMEELYRFYANNEEYGNELMNNFLNSYPKFLKGKDNWKVASKSGWAGSVLHEMTIIFADNPYILIALSNLGDKEYQYYFDTVNELTYKLHEEYWKYKMEKCNNIKQY